MKYSETSGIVFIRLLIVIALLVFGVTGRPVLYAQKEYAPIGNFRIQPYAEKRDTLTNADWQKTIRLPENMQPLIIWADMGIAVYQQVWKTNRENTTPQFLSDIFWGLAECYNIKKDYKKNIFYLVQSIEQDKLKNRKIPEKYAILCQLYVVTGEFDKAIQISKASFPGVKSAQDSFYIAFIDMSVAEAYSKSGKWDTSNLMYHKALSKWPDVDSGNAAFLAMLYVGLSQASFRLKLPDKALSYIRKGIQVVERYNSPDIKAGLIAAEGSAYLLLKDTVRAKQKLYQAVIFGRKNHHNGIIAMNAYNLAAISVMQKKYGEALSFGLESLEAAGKTRDFSLQVNSLFLIGYLHYDSKDYSKMEYYLRQAIQQAEKRNYLAHLDEAYYMLGISYYKRGRYKEAYEYNRKYSKIRYSMLNKEVAELIAESEAKYQSAEKDKVLTQQKLELQKKEVKLREKNFWIWGTVASLFFLSSLFLFWYRYNRHKQKSIVVQLQQQQEISVLKAKVEAEQQERNRIGKELHDGIVSQLLGIKLNLNALESNESGMVEKKAVEHINRQLTEATMDLRNTAHNLLPEGLLRRGLVDAIQTLCDNATRSAKLEVDYQVYGEMPILHNEAALSIYRIVQELVQNTIKHAEATQLLIQLCYRNDILSITVEDNGKGFSADEQESTIYSVGLTNVKQRVGILNGTIDITSVPWEETVMYMEFEKKYIEG